MYINDLYWKEKYEILKEQFNFLSKKHIDSSLIRKILYLEFNKKQKEYLEREPIKVKVLSGGIFRGNHPNFCYHEKTFYNNRPVSRNNGIYECMYSFTHMWEDEPTNLTTICIRILIDTRMAYEDAERYRLFKQKYNYKKIELYDIFNNDEVNKRLEDRFFDEPESANLHEIEPVDYKNNKYLWHDFEYFFRREIENHRLRLKDF